MYLYISTIFPNTTVQFSSVQSLSRVQLFATPWIAACQASLSITNSRSPLRLTSIESVMPSSHLILCCKVYINKTYRCSERLDWQFAQPGLLTCWNVRAILSGTGSRWTNHKPPLTSARMENTLVGGIYGNEWITKEKIRKWSGSEIFINFWVYASYITKDLEILGAIWERESYLIFLFLVYITYIFKAHPHLYFQ